MSRKRHPSKRKLSRQQLKLVQLIAEGRSNREIAQVIGTTEQVVQDQLRDVQDKLRLSCRVELILLAHSTPANKSRLT